MNELMKVEGLNAIDLFEKKEVGVLISGIQEQARALIPDISDEKGRNDINDLGKKVRKCSKVLDDLGKTHVAFLKALPKEIDSQRKKMREDLDELYTEVRSPLTNWENEEKARLELIQIKINAMMAMPCGVASERISNKVLADIFLTEIQATKIDESFGESQEYAQKTKSENELIVKGVIANFAIEAQAEVERLEAEKKEQEERDKRIAKEAKEQAERAAEQSIKAAKDAEELAVKNAKIAEIKAKNDVKDAEKRADLAKKQAEHTAKLKAEQAVQDEKDRVERARQADTAKQEKLAANKKHSARINNEIVAAITLAISEVHSGNQNEAVLIAKAIVVASAKNEIPHVSIKY